MLSLCLCECGPHSPIATKWPLSGFDTFKKPELSPTMFYSVETTFTFAMDFDVFYIRHVHALLVGLFISVPQFIRFS